MRLEKPSTIKSPPPPVSSLSIPAPPTISTVKQPTVVVPSEKGGVSLGTKTITIDLTKSPSSAAVATSNVPPSPLSSPLGFAASSGGKMKRERRTASHYRNKREEEDLAPPPSFLTNPVPLKLPSSLTAIPLPGLTTPPKVGDYYSVKLFFLFSYDNFFPYVCLS